MASHTLDEYHEIEFINTVFPDPHRGGIYRRRVRRHVMNRSWQVRKDQARSCALPGDRLLRASRQIPTCKCYQPGNAKNMAAKESCLQCQSVPVPRRMEACNPYSEDVNDDSMGEGNTALAGEFNATNECSALELGNIRSLLDSGNRDPFSSFPISTGLDDRGVEMLLQHWITELSPVLCTLEYASKITANPVSEVLVPLALNDSAVLHALLSFSSGLVDARSGLKTGSTTTLIHRLNAIRLINQSMNDLQLATSDKILTSIMFVSGSDCMFKDYGGHRTHLDGIYRIVELRGGIENIRQTLPIVYWRIIWADQFRSLYTNTPPRFQISPSSFIPLAMNQNSSLPANESEPWHTHFSLSDEFIDLAKEISNLVQVLESSKGTLVSRTMVEHYDQQRAWIASRLLYLIAETSNNPARVYEQCCYLATIVYHLLHFKPYTFLTGVESMLLGKLKQTLEQTDLDACWGDDIELLLWISFTAAAVEDVLRDWFVELLKQVRRALVPKPGLKRLKFILSKFLWNERTSSPTCDKLYKQIVGSGLEGEAYEMQIHLGPEHGAFDS